uniref:Transcription factor CBF/NF-Y/archaeal histone domain-containing protein n=1 Tax=Ostreococcus sp. 'lucimarinus' TaxID=242159 RepID=A0A7R9XRB7_9CHLO
MSGAPGSNEHPNVPTYHGIPGVALPFAPPPGAPVLTPEQFQEQYGAQLRQHQAQIAHAVAMNAAQAAANPAYAAQQAALRQFWREMMIEIQQTNDFKNHLLPLARIKKIMKSDEDVRMISSEAPVLFAKACEMFVLELTTRAWAHAQENKRRTLQRSDVAAAITKTDIFDFLVDIVPREPGDGGDADHMPALGAAIAMPPVFPGFPGVPGFPNVLGAPPPAPPPGYDAFAVERVIALAVRDAGRGRDASVRAWLAEPANFVELVFGAADARERERRGPRGGRAYDVAVAPRALLAWEIAPAFAIEAIAADGAGRVDGRARLVGDELRFAGDKAKLPPGFATMGVWAHIDARVGIDESRSSATETVVETEVRVKIAAEVPRLLRAIPGFSKAATMTIGRSIDIVGGGIDGAAQRTYDRWAAQRGTASAED